MAYSDDGKRNYYTIRIPSMEMEMYSDPNQFRNIKDIKRIAFIRLSPTLPDICLPMRLRRKAGISRVSDEQPLFIARVPGIGKVYSSKQCAAPECHLSVMDGPDHLNLCPDHVRELDEILKHTQNLFSLNAPSSMEDDELHKMTYHSLLPSIDRLLEEIKSKTESTHTELVEQVLLIFKALIYIYRIHLNPFGPLLNVFTCAFLYVLRQNEPQFLVVVQNVLRLIAAAFYLCGISLTWMSNILLGDESNLGMVIAGLGGSGLAWGIMQVLNAGRAATFQHWAAIGLGAAGIAIGANIITKRFRRGRPCAGCVNVTIWLNRVYPYLEQRFQA